MKRVLLVASCAIVIIVGCGKGSDNAESGGSPIGTWLVDSKSQEFSTAGPTADGGEAGGPGAYATFQYSHKIKIEANQISFISECAVPEASQSTQTIATSPITIDGKAITLQSKSLSKTGTLTAKSRYFECNVNVTVNGPLQYSRIDDTHLSVTLTGGKQTLTLVQ